MKLAVESDQTGYELKEKVKAYLLEKEHEVEDLGTTDVQAPLPYFEAARDICHRIKEGRAERGFLVCGTGAGMCIHANKHQGIFAVVSESVYSVRLYRIVNDANVLTFGSRIMPTDMTCEMADVFIKTEFIEGTGLGRVEHLMDQQQRYLELERSFGKGAVDKEVGHEI